MHQHPTFPSASALVDFHKNYNKLNKDNISNCSVSHAPYLRASCARHPFLQSKTVLFVHIKERVTTSSTSQSLAEKLVLPKSVKTDTQDYRASQVKMGDFLLLQSVNCLMRYGRYFVSQILNLSLEYNLVKEPRIAH